MMQLFTISHDCPMPSQIGNGTRCEFMKSPSEFCSLRWDSTSENSTIKLMNCSTGSGIDPQAHKIETTSTTAAIEISTYIYIIIGACLGLLILLIVVITLFKIKVKRLKKEYELKKNCIAENATTPNDGNNPVNGDKSEDLCYEEVEDGQIVSGARIFQSRNQKNPIHNSKAIASKSNDKYLYTVPDREENSFNQAPEESNYMKAYMYIK